MKGITKLSVMEDTGVCEAVRSPHQWAVQDSNKKSQGVSGKALNETPPSKRVPNQVPNAEKVPDISAKWDSLTDIEKQLIMKLLK